MINTKMVDKLRKKHLVFGSFVRINEPCLIESYGRAGYDYIILEPNMELITSMNWKI
jgi:2-keto-3-deoxy-L-rhamnonate aldolase RhmA